MFLDTLLDTFCDAVRTTGAVVTAGIAAGGNAGIDALIFFGAGLDFFAFLTGTAETLLFFCWVVFCLVNFGFALPTTGL